MSRLLVGVVLGGALVAGAALLFLRGSDACLGRCGDGTRCQDRRCVVVAAGPAPAPIAKEERKKKRSNAATAGPVEMKPGDERVIAQGDALGRPQHVDFTKQGDEGHDRTQEELDLVFHRADSSILRCVTDALGDAPLETGRVEVGLRVEASGQVTRVRVEAPKILLNRGLYACIKNVTTALRFGPAGGASVVTWPFELK